MKDQLPPERRRCLACGFEWLQQAGPHFGHGGYVIGLQIAAGCPRCEHDYNEVLPSGDSLLPLDTYASNSGAGGVVSTPAPGRKTAAPS